MKTKLMASCCLTAVLAAASASAQGVSGANLPNTSPVGGAPSSNGTPTEAGSKELETVVVTAQKRVENAQNIPIAITVVSPTTLQRSGIEDITELQKVLPEIRITQFTGNLNISIRGVGTTLLGSTSDSPTAVHLDGVYLSRPTGLTGFFFDMQRLEQLDGPQGTLYGRNATGGVINLITNKPGPNFGGNIEVEGGNYGLYRFNAAVNVPINDYVEVRAAGRIYHHDGYFSNGLSDAGEKSARLETKVKFTPDINLLLTTDYEETNQKGQGLALVAEDYSSNGVAPNLAAHPLEKNLYVANPYIYPNGTKGDHQTAKDYGAMAELDDDLHFATLTGQFGFRREIAELDAQGPGDGGQAASGELKTPSDATTYSGEIRLASPAKAALQWVGGLFYFTEQTSGQTCIAPSLVPIPGLPACIIKYANPFQRTRSYAAFGQATYTPPVLSDRLHLTGGARYNLDRKIADAYEAIFGVIPPGGANYGLRATFRAVTYRAEASYDITPTSLVYVQNSTGFRAGGFEYGITPEYKPENIIAYEVGSKSRFFDNTLQVNVAVWEYIYKNQATQVAYFVPQTPVPIQTVISIGKVNFQGVSASIEYAATRDDRIAFNVIYSHNHFTRFQIPAGYQNAQPLNDLGLPTGQEPGNATGLEVPGTAPWAGNFSYDHTVRALSGEFDARAAVQFSDRVDYSASYTNTLQYQASLVQPFARLDLSVSYTPDHGAWKATAYVNNVTNETDLVVPTYEGTSSGTGDVTANLMPPRTYGGFVSYKF